MLSDWVAETREACDRGEFLQGLPLLLRDIYGQTVFLLLRLNSISQRHDARIKSGNYIKSKRRITRMTEKELSDVLAKGESRTVEFKKSTADITKDIYETVCSFSNRDGGDIFSV